MNIQNQLVVPTDNFGLVCRLCLSMNEKLCYIYRMDEIETLPITVSMKLALCTAVKMSKHDLLPQKICQKCLNFVNDWYLFRGKCKQVDAALKKYLVEHKPLDTDNSAKFKYFDIDLDDAEMNDEFQDVFLEADIAETDITGPDQDLDEEPTFTDLDNQTFSLEEPQPAPLEPTPQEPVFTKRKRRFQCPYCPDSFYFVKDLVRHKTMLHQKKEAEVTAEKIVRRERKLRAKREEKLEDFMKRPRYEMKCCGKVFYYKAKFSKHYRKEHPGEKPYMCDMCGKKAFISEETLKRHKVLHTERHKCDICDRTFTCNAILMIHKRDKHDDDKPFVCDVCGKRFVTELVMNYHKRFHTGEKKYVCPECGLAVVTSSSLSKHRRTHSMVKPHVCEKCGKGFIIKGRLIEHLRVHNGERPYVCDICKKGFTIREKLRRHLQVHSGEKTFACEFCGNTYTTSYGLTFHLRTHARHL